MMMFRTSLVLCGLMRKKVHTPVGILVRVAARLLIVFFIILSAESNTIGGLNLPTACFGLFHTFHLLALNPISGGKNLREHTHEGEVSSIMAVVIVL